MMFDKLKTANINIHIIATGAGAGLQQKLWEVPGSSAYLSGCSFPYATDEQEEILGFMPEHFCSEEAAVDLASAAYMKAYKFGGKNPVGVGLTASVASEVEHRGDHRVHACIITDDKVVCAHKTFEKGVGLSRRQLDGEECDDLGAFLLIDTLGIATSNFSFSDYLSYKDATDLAQARFFRYPFFSSNGKRLKTVPKSQHWALMPGAYNPPHEGHFGTADQVLNEYNRRVIFEITAEPPHKDTLSIQDLLKRAKLLQGHDRFFTRQEPLYIDKARSFPGVPLVMGADSMLRMLDSKWGVDLVDSFEEFKDLKTTLYVAGRTVNGKFITREDLLEDISPELHGLFDLVTKSVGGHWDISSTELRKKLL